ncbi:MAG: DoxX family protein [Bacteroidota bacterium]
MIYPWHLYLMAGIYILAGTIHFLKPKTYLRIMPRYLPAPKLLVYLSGAAEILLGIGLIFEETKDLAIYGIILMLIVFLLVHFYMLSSKKAGAGIPVWALWLRIPLQFGLMWWAFYYLQF